MSPDPIPLCVVCGEDIFADAHLSLAVYWVADRNGRGLWFEPPEQPASLSSWEDVSVMTHVHAGCLTDYVQGVQVDIEFRRKHQHD